MSTDYSVKEVRTLSDGIRRIAGGALSDYDGVKADEQALNKAADMLLGLAERIEADDERAVPVAWQQRRRPEDYPDEWRECSKETFDFVNQRKESPWSVRELFDNPPAQVVQVDKPPRLGGCCCGEPCTLGTVHRTDGPCFVYDAPTAEPSTHPHSPDAADSGRVTIDFGSIGSAGPFSIINGKVTLPDVTLVDLVHRMQPTLADPRQGETGGTFACPICGEELVHHHSAEDVRAWAAAQANRFLPSLGDPKEASAKPLGYLSANHERFIPARCWEASMTLGGWIAVFATPPASPAGVPEVSNRHLAIAGVPSKYWDEARKAYELAAAPSATPEGGEVGL